MSAAKWATPAVSAPYGFRLTIERVGERSPEKVTILRKTPSRAAAVQAAGYKKGFLRLVEAVPLTREEWERESGKAAAR